MGNPIEAVVLVVTETSTGLVAEGASFLGCVRIIPLILIYDFSGV